MKCHRAFTVQGLIIIKFKILDILPHHPSFLFYHVETLLHFPLYDVLMKARERMSIQMHFNESIYFLISLVSYIIFSASHKYVQLERLLIIINKRKIQF